MEKKHRGLKKASAAYIWGAGVLSAVIALLVLWGWRTQNLALVQMHPGLPSMQFNTAVCFLGSAITLLLLQAGKHRAVLVPSLFSCMLALATLMQYITNTSYGVDALFTDSLLTAGAIKSGRMAPNTAFALILLNVALIFGDISRLNGLRALTVLLAASMAAALGIVPILGYISGVETAYGWQNFAHMSILSALCLVLLGTATLIYVQRKLDSTFWLPVPVGIALAVIAISMSYALRQQEYAHLTTIVHAEAEHLAHGAERQFTDVRQALWRITQRWQTSGGTPEALWRSDVEAYLKNYSFLTAAIRLDAAGKTIWEEAKVSQEQASEIMEYIAKNNAAELQNIMTSRQPMNLGAVGLDDGRKAYVIAYPLYHGRDNDGVMVALLSMDAFFHTVLNSIMNSRVLLSVSENGETIFSMPPDVGAENNYTASITLGGDDAPSWILNVQASKFLRDQVITRLPWMVLIAGLLISSFALSALVLFFRLRRSEALLKERKARLRAAMQGAVDGIMLINGIGEIEEFNPACEAMFGYSSAEVVGRNVDMLLLESDHGESDKYFSIQHHISGKKNFGVSWEVKGRRKEGNAFDVDLRISEVKIPGRVLYMGMLRDITERKKMEQETAKLIAAIEESSEFIGMADMDGNLQYHNRSAKRIVGLADDFDMAGMKIADMHPPYAYKRMQETIIPLVMEKGFWKGENTLLHRNGSEIPVLQTLVLHRDADGRPLYLTTIMQDITMQKAQEAALHQSQEGLNLGWQGTGVGLWDWDMMTNRLNFSDRLKELLGYRPDEMTDHFNEWESRVHPDDLGGALIKLNAHLAQRAPYRTEYRMKTKSGEWRWYYACGQAAWNANGKPVRMAGSLEDITERRKAEERQRQLVDKLAESNTELERFAYVASHDLREPLRLVANFAALLRKEYAGQLDAGAREYISVINDSATRMHGMVGDLLEYARIGNEEMRYSKVSMEEQMRRVMENLASFIEEHQATVTHDALPEVMGNPIQLMRLLQNLVGNAIKFHAKDVLPRVHIGVDERQDEWYFYVKDNGIGVASEYAAQIFEPFRRLHARNEYMGTGIGLAICKRIVEKHGGLIGVESEPGKGSMFYFTIPK